MYFTSIKRYLLKVFSKVIPTDYFSIRHPVSIKGICFIDNKVILLKNERNEWDLPGGKLNKNENIKDCLAREIKEELNIDITVDELLEVSQKKVMDMVSVLILIYSCSTTSVKSDLKISFEHYEVGTFTLQEIEKLIMADTYKLAIKKAYHQLVLA